MKHLFFLLAIVFISIASSAQQKKYIGFSFFNSETDMPFGKFLGMFKDALHPGLEFTYGKIKSAKKNHEWFREWKLAWFYHRYVQTGFPLYFNYGYRRLFKKHLYAETSIGAGIMKMIPDMDIFHVNNDIEWEKFKSKGPLQLILTYGIGLGYTLNPGAEKPIRIFTNYQQRLQNEFAGSYVPVLPYNNFFIGLTKSIGSKKSK